jgi:hypothetical protein
MTACGESDTESRSIAEIENENTNEDDDGSSWIDEEGVGSSWIDEDGVGSNWDEAEYVDEAVIDDEEDDSDFWNWSGDEEDREYEDGGYEVDDFLVPDCNRQGVRAECSYLIDTDDDE